MRIFCELKNMRNFAPAKKSEKRRNASLAQLARARDL